MARQSAILLGLLPFFGMAACSTVKVKPAEVRAVHSAAVVGFSVSMDPGEAVPQETYDPESKEWKKFLPGQLGNLQDHPEMIRLYETLVEGLKSELRWNVLSEPGLQQSEAFRSHTSFKVGALWSPPELGGNIRWYGLQRVLPYDEADRMGIQARETLMRELKVDALIFVRVHITLARSDALSISSLLGVGTVYPGATLEIRAFGHGDAEAIWADEDVRAEEAAERKQGAFQVAGVPSADALMSSATGAFRLSFKELILRYRTAAAD